MIPDPVIVEEQGGIGVTFLKDIYTEEYLRRFDLNDRQTKALLYAKEHGSVASAVYQKINNIGRTIATQELVDLVNKGLLKKSGTVGRSSKYLIVQ